MSNVKLRVWGEDGKEVPAWFTDGPWREPRWDGVLSNGVQESMVGSAPPADGPWFLIQYVHPRQFSGEAERDSLVDEASRCLCQTPAQALRWFGEQPFGPPPALVTQVRAFAAEWAVFVDSPSCRRVLEHLVERGFVAEADPLLASGEGQLHLRRLLNLELAQPAVRRESGYEAKALVRSQEVAGFIDWMGRHLDSVAHLLHPLHGASGPSRGGASGNARYTAAGPVAAPEVAGLPVEAQPMNGSADVPRAWAAAAHEWRKRITVVPAVGSQPAKVYLDLSGLPGAPARPLQTDPALALDLLDLSNHPTATEAFAQIARTLAEQSDLLATHIDVPDIDGSKAYVFAEKLRRAPALPTTEHLALFDEVAVLGKRLKARAHGPTPRSPAPTAATTGGR